MVKENSKVFSYKSWIKKWLESFMVKVCVNFKTVCFFGYIWKNFAFVGVVFTWFLFCKILAALQLSYFLNNFFLIKIYFLSYETLHIFYFYEYASFSRILNVLLLKQLFFKTKQFNISYNSNFVLNNASGLYSLEKRIKMFEYFREEIANNGILFLQ